LNALLWKSKKGNNMAYRTQRIEKIIEKELAQILFSEAHNPLLKFVSITKVRLTPDMSIATVWYTIFGTEEEKKATENALLTSKGFLRSELAQILSTYKTPDLKFKYDDSMEKGNHILELLEKAKNQNKEQ
jgi:ribosome-binding factor A